MSPSPASITPILKRLKVSCASCSLHELCLPGGVDKTTLAELDLAVDRLEPFKRGDSIFRQGDALAALFVVRAGSARSIRLGSEGNEQVLGFHFPGDLIGLDAMDDSRHQVTAECLERTHLCALPLSRLDSVLERVPSLRRQMLRIMSRNQAEDYRHLDLMGRKSATARVAAWLLALSRRLKARGYDPDRLTLSMSRRDLGNYLGLAIETVSRTLSRLQADGVIEVSGRHVTIIDGNRLVEAADAGCS